MLFFLNLQHFPATTFLDENLKYPRHHPHTCFLGFCLYEEKVCRMLVIWLILVLCFSTQPAYGGFGKKTVKIFAQHLCIMKSSWIFLYISRWLKTELCGNFALSYMGDRSYFSSENGSARNFSPSPPLMNPSLCFFTCCNIKGGEREVMLKIF